MATDLSSFLQEKLIERKIGKSHLIQILGIPRQGIIRLLQPDYMLNDRIASVIKDIIQNLRAYQILTKPNYPSFSKKLSDLIDENSLDLSFEELHNITGLPICSFYAWLTDFKNPHPKLQNAVTNELFSNALNNK